MFFVKSWLSYLLFVVLSTEILSLFDGITRINVLIANALGLIIFILATKNCWTWPRIRFDRVWIVAIATIILPLLLVAIYYPPNNWDSMTYHMSRVMHWIQNKNVNFYPTNNERQLFMGVTAEYVILHWRIIFGSDIFSNLVQFVSMVGSVIGVGLITKELGGSKKTGQLAKVLALTIPMGILQSTTTQTDYVASFCLVAFILFGYRKEFWWWSVALAIGILTKTTFVIFAFPFGIYFGINWIIFYKYNLWKFAVGTLVIILVLNGPLWWRNFQYFGNISGPKSASNAMVNEKFDSTHLTSNLVRNTAMNLGLPNNRYNLLIDRIVYKIHDKIGLKIDDVSTTFLGRQYKTWFLLDEDIMGNIFVTVLMGLAIIFLRNNSKVTNIYYGCLIGGWVLFSLILKWQPWGTRLQLPFFVVATPVLAIIYHKYFVKRWALFGLILLSAPFVAGNMIISWNGWLTLSGSSRQIGRKMLELPYNRELKYYTRNLSLYSQHRRVVELLIDSKVKHVALDIGGESWEYPLWVMLQSRNKNIRMEYLRDNPDFEYEAVVYDVIDTEKLVEKNRIATKADFGMVKLMLLKVQ